jgi:hypothetical protein
MNLVNAVKAFLNGDWDAAWGYIWEALKNGAQVAIDFVLGKLMILAEGINSLTGWDGPLRAMEAIWDRTRLVNYNFKEAAALLGLINNLTKQTEEITGNITKEQEAWIETERVLIDAGAIKKGYTIDSLKNNADITEEHRAQLTALDHTKQILKSIARQEEIITELKKQQALWAKAGEGGGGEQWFTKIQSDIWAAEKEIDRLRKSSDEVIKSASGASQEFGAWEDDIDDAGLAMDGLADSTDKASDAAEEARRKQQEWLGALRSSMQNVMSEIVQAVNDVLDAQRDSINKHFDQLDERAKTNAEREENRIKANEEARVGAIEKEIDRLKEAEKAREEHFRREKVRLDYMQSRSQGNINIRSSLARGDFDAAAIERERLYYDEQRYISELNQVNEKSATEREIDSLNSKKNQVQEEAKLELSRTKTLSEESAKRLKAEREAAIKAYEHRRHLINRDLENWKKVTPKTQAEFNKHMGKLNGILQRGGVKMTDVTKRFAYNSGARLRDGFKKGVNDARAALAEERKWTVAGKTAGKAASDGFRGAMTKGISDLGKDLDKAFKGKTVGYNVDPGNTGRQTHIAPGNIVGYMHSGGPVTGAGGPAPLGYSSLKKDEEPRILQHGEYVVQKKAVKAVGKGYLEALNNMKMHSGGIVDFTKQRFSNVSKLLSGAAGNALGQIPTRVAGQMVKDANGNLHEHGKGPGEDTLKRHGQAAIKQVRDVFKAFVAEGGGAGIPGSAGSAGGGWPARQWGRLSSNTAGAMNFIRGKWRLPHGVGTGTDRGVASSDHSWGKALDSMVSKLGTMPNANQRRTGWEIANWFDKNPRRFGTKYNIYDKLWKKPHETRWKPYTRYGNNPGPTLGHYDHVHTSFMHDGGLVKPPGMRVGGMVNYDNTIANLHKKETVLTAPLSASLQQGIKNMEAGNIGGDNINITINAPDTMDVNALADVVVKKIDYAKRRKGRDRRVTTN